MGVSVGMSSLLKTDFLNLNVVFKSLQNIKLCLLELMAVYAVSQRGFFNNQSVQWECGCRDLYPLPQVFANSAPLEIGYNYKPLQTSLVWSLLPSDKHTLCKCAASVEALSSERSHGLKELWQAFFTSSHTAAAST